MICKVIDWVITIIGVVVFAGFIVIALAEWMAGCGETYVDADGVRHQYECLFISTHNKGAK